MTLCSTQDEKYMYTLAFFEGVHHIAAAAWTTNVANNATTTAAIGRAGGIVCRVVFRHSFYRALHRVLRTVPQRLSKSPRHWSKLSHDYIRAATVPQAC